MKHLVFALFLLCACKSEKQKAGDALRPVTKQGILINELIKDDDKYLMEYLRDGDTARARVVKNELDSLWRISDSLRHISDSLFKIIHKDQK